MTAPPKPWETIQTQGTATQQRQIFPGLARTQTGVANGYAGYGTATPATATPVATAVNTGGAAPPPPPRPAGALTQRSVMRSPYGMQGGYSSYPGYGSPYGMRSGYGSYGSYGSPYSSYGMMGGYGGYGGYGQSYGGYGQMPYGQNAYSHPGLESRFIQLAEENSRPAFESLESLVHAFGSVSMMMESTFFAIHSSFRAVLGVAENFGRMRGLLAQVFSALTIFRAVRWAAIRLLQILGLRKAGEADQMWAEAASAVGRSGAAPAGLTDTERRSSAWPIVMFLSLIMGGPYLIWKLLRSVQASLADPNLSSVQNSQVEEPWMSGRSPCYIAQAVHTFEARQADELSFAAREVLAMAPAQQQTLRNHGWMLATRIRDVAGNPVPRPSKVGLVPSNHFRTLYSKPGKRAATPASPSVVAMDGDGSATVQQSVPLGTLDASLLTEVPAAPAVVQEPVVLAAEPPPADDAVTDPPSEISETSSEDQPNQTPAALV